MNLLPSLLSGSVIRIETAFTPPLDVRLDDVAAPGSEPSTAVQMFRPRVTVIKDGVTIFVSEPAGSPEKGPDYLVLMGFAAALVLVLIWAKP